jgi:hypothetical protein
MSNPIKPVPHQPAPPVSIERTGRDEIIIEGVTYSGDFFRTMGLPNPDYLYAIRRDGDQVILTTIHNAGEATGYFFKQAYKSGGA